ncbi:GYF domain-containing protein [Rubritalea sp.]|uniref:DUF4339 domain-containing protein n=1 Tax=Rubritalea sp. TaxID=2109375 RepID=UPI003EF70922
MWYFTLDGQQAGPISQQELSKKFNGELPTDTLVWKQGMSSWKSASEVTEFKNIERDVNTPPPLPQAHAYTSPVSNPVYSVNSTTYSLPKVKKTNYPLLLVFGSVGILCIVIGYIFLFSTILSNTMAAAQNEIGRMEQKAQHAAESQSEAGFPTGNELTPQAAEFTELESQMTSAMMEGMGTFTVLLSIGWIFSVIAYIFGLIYLHRAWTLLQPSGTAVSPAKAVGFLFIPFFNLYWIFVAYRQWAEEWNKVQSRHTTLTAAPKASEGAFLAMGIAHCSIIITSVLGLFASSVLYFVGMKSMCDVINYAAEHGTDEA